MRANRAAILLGLAGLLFLSLGASDDALKIAIVDLEQALASTEEGKGDLLEDQKRPTAKLELELMIQA